MDRSDTRREMTGGASMARSKSAAKDEMSEHTTGGSKHEREVGMGSGIGSKTVEAHGAIGSHNAVEAKGAEGDTDNASAKANRKENYEPERERAEQSAMDRSTVEHEHTFGDGKRGSAVSHKNTMGYGERETKACNTI